jgi:hypothetical protein
MDVTTRLSEINFNCEMHELRESAWLGRQFALTMHDRLAVLYLLAIEFAMGLKIPCSKLQGSYC